MMKHFSLIVVFFLCCQWGYSRQQVDTVTVFSAKMNKNIKAVVVLPEKYSTKKKYPVVYLLHGFSDNYSKWVNTVPDIKNLATEHQIILVCPDGGYSSWYIDSPIDPSYQYETYITRELLPYVDLHYATIASRTARAITGLSMGGHGALYLAIRNKDLFSSAGSMSGGVDLQASRNKYDISKRIGTLEDAPDQWRDRSVVNMVTGLKNKDLNLMVDCGVDDFFYQINVELHRKMLALKLDHEYIERPGVHNWEYWSNAIHYQLLFFDRNFKRPKSN